MVAISPNLNFKKNIEARCMRCKGPKQMKNEQEVEMNKKGGKKGRMMKGECVDCGCKMCKILPSKK